MVIEPGFNIWFIMASYYKMRQILLQNTTATLLQNAIKVYYKMGQLLQIATILLQNATVITKCDIYYKLTLQKQRAAPKGRDRRRVQRMGSIFRFAKKANKKSNGYKSQ